MSNGNNLDLKNRERISGRITGSFGTNYLTLISIIQSAAIGYLATIVLDKWLYLCLSQRILSLANFLIFVAVWNEYAMGATCLIWIPDLKDSLIPFFFGALEFTVVQLAVSNESHWYLAMGVFWALGIGAYANMFLSAKRREIADQNEGILVALGVHTVFAYVYCCVASIFFFLAWGWLGVCKRPDHLFLPFTSVGLLVIFFIRSHFYWRRMLRYCFGGKS